jgi:hypothetical protein
MANGHARKNGAAVSQPDVAPNIHVTTGPRSLLIWS